MAFRHTEATKRKLSDMRRGEANPFFGRKHSPETLAKLAAATRTFNASRQYAINPRSLPDLAEWQRAYIAGLIDGEGTITMPVGRKGVQVSIANTYRPMIDWLVATCGGSVTKSNNPIAREPCWVWYISAARDVFAMLETTRPFLIIKANRADEAMASLRAKYGERLWAM